MTVGSTVDTYFEAIGGSHAALFEAVTASIGRNHRLSSSFLTETQRSQHELLELGRAFAADPSEPRDMPRRVQASAERGRERRREARRQWLDEFAEARKETLETLERLQAQRRVMEDTTEELARRTFGTIIDRLQDGLRRLIELTEAQRGARQAPQAEARRKRTSPPEWLASSASPATAVEANPETPATAPETRRGAARASGAPVTP